MQFTLNRSIRFVAFILSTSQAGIAGAETLYVSDELAITLRTGPGVKNKITSMLKSGEDLEIIQKNSDGYTEVPTANGKTGWVLQRFLMAEPSARSRLDGIDLREKELNEQQQEISILRTGAVDSETQLLATKQTNSKLKEELKRVKKVAADTLIINEKNQQLSEALALAEAENAPADEDRILQNALDQAASSVALATETSAALDLTADYDRWLNAKLQQSRDWLSQANRNSVSIQVFVRSKSAVRELVYYLRNEWPLDLSETYLYEVSTEDRSIYRVFYSEFDSLSGGRNQLERLPESVKRNSPYLHSVYRMQKALL